jgi:hypothetical protein
MSLASTERTSVKFDNEYFYEKLPTKSRLGYNRTENNRALYLKTWVRFIVAGTVPEDPGTIYSAGIIPENLGRVYCCWQYT